MENQWEKISWSQALDEIADKLKDLKSQYGAETLSVVEGTLRSDLCGIRSRFLNLLAILVIWALPGSPAAVIKRPWIWH